VGTTASEIDAIILVQTRKVDDVIVGGVQRAQVESRKSTENFVRTCHNVQFIYFSGECLCESDNRSTVCS
jgi:hypothetical protein